MQVLQVIVDAIGWIIATSWSTISLLFWIAVFLFAATFVAVLFRRPTADAPAAVDPVEAVREALRRGDLDADIGRVEQRNRRRGSPQ